MEGRVLMSCVTAGPGDVVFVWGGVYPNAGDLRIRSYAGSSPSRKLGFSKLESELGFVLSQ